MADKGANVIILDINQANLNKFVNEIRVTVIKIQDMSVMQGVSMKSKK